MNQETFSVEYYRNPITWDAERKEREAAKASFKPVIYDQATVQAKVEELKKKRAENTRELKEVRD